MSSFNPLLEFEKKAQSSQYVPMPSVGKSLRPALGDLEVPEAKK